MTRTRAAVVVRAGLSAWLMFAACGALAQNTPLLTVPSGPLFVEEGETTMITVSLDSSTSRDVQINYMIRTGDSRDIGFQPGGPVYEGVSTDDYTVTPEGSVTIETDGTEANISISIRDDDEIESVREPMAVFFPPPPAGAGYRLDSADGSTTILVIKEGVCDRNEQLVEVILDAVPGEHDCADIDREQIRRIESLDVPSLTSPLRAGDFWDFNLLDELDLSARLSQRTLPDGLFVGATTVDKLDLSSNTLTTLSPGAFSGDVFQQPTLDNALKELYLGNLPLTGLPAGFFGAFLDQGFIALRGVHLPVDADGEPLLPLDVGFVRVGEKESTTVADLKLTVAQGAPYDITADLSASRATVSAGGNPVSQLSITRGKTESEIFTLTRTTDEPGVVTVTLSSPPDTEDCRRPSLQGEKGEDHACYVGVAFSPAKPGFRLGAGAPTLRIKLFLEGALE